MPKKQEDPQSNDPTKPWAKKFEDDRDDDGNLSRVATRQKHHGTTVLTYVVWILIAAFVIVPITISAISQNSSGSGNDSMHITVESSSKATTSSKQKTKKKASSSKSASSKPASTSSSKPASSSSSVAASSSQSASSVAESSSSAASTSTSSATSSSSTTASGSYTVQAGDNPYRIAKNHGMTLAEFYALNGQGTLVPGQSVKVK
ncbi:LysM peptidoglycan-binding domain-containing protein [Lacticaseibacillus parakribbianus]|uniref:LysM peptidoglycan-binding domain-containing protein n=1 Tax=Lacticaseibacillus parakribbianus TaxID=2970927 RepID=UPI0021CB9213|nr:LysM domain-containing protein [Lacticaseibacillus parakribbianus]